MKILLRKLLYLIELEIKNLEASMKAINNSDIEAQFDKETGHRFNALINRYPISEDALINMSEICCKYMSYTQNPNIKNLLFYDNEMTHPRINYRLI
jgi:hypothetical protein